MKTLPALAMSCLLLSSSAPPQTEIPNNMSQSPVTLRIDLMQSLGSYHPVYNWFGYDEGNYTTTPHGRHLLGELHDLSPVPVYIRVHHLLTSGDGSPELKWSSTGVYREGPDGKPVYNFSILDGIFDAFKAAGVRPMVELGFMPQDLAANLPDRHEPYQVHFPASTISGSSNNPPKDYARWGDLVRAVTAHLVQRYGADTVRQWPFEVWNEPDIDYWHASAQDYWKLYDFGVAGVQAALPGAMVGGPASTSLRNPHAYGFLEDFLKHVESGKSAADGGPVPMSFISFHVKGQPRIEAAKVTMGLQQELQDADKGFALIEGHPRLRGLPVILSEADPEGCAACSSKMNPANNYRNGTLYAAYTAAAYKGLLDLSARHHVNLLAMLSWSFEFEDRDSFEGFRSLATNGVDKPILNLFRMLGLMEGGRVKTISTSDVGLDDLLAAGVRQHPDVDALATASAHQASVLLWNYADAANSLASRETLTVISGLPKDVSRALLTEYRIDETHSNAYTVWQGMGSPARPDPAQFETLKRRDGLEMLGSPRWIDVVNGAAELPDTLPAQGISLLQLRW